jgi:hypothetical protein
MTRSLKSCLSFPYLHIPIGHVDLLIQEQNRPDAELPSSHRLAAELSLPVADASLHPLLLLRQLMRLDGDGLGGRNRTARPPRRASWVTNSCWPLRKRAYALGLSSHLHTNKTTEGRTGTVKMRPLTSIQKSARNTSERCVVRSHRGPHRRQGQRP